MESIRDTVAINCKRLLNRSKNLGEIARLMQISPTTISRWKSGSHSPELDKIDRLAEILNVDVAEFFKAENDKKTIPKVSSLLRSLSAIPDEVYERAQFHAGNHELWDAVMGVFDDFESVAASKSEAK